MGPPAQLMSLGEATHESRREALAATFSLRNIAIEGISGLVPLLAFHERREDLEIPAAVLEWVDLLVTEVEHSRRRASEELAQLGELIAQSQQLEGGMGLRFLYDEERRIFAVGYQVAERRLDSSFYDLLASEARLTSFLAIARGDVPMEHWWALSRPFGSAYGRLPLLSWSGTMVEYLIPLLFTQMHENSLLDRACRGTGRRREKSAEACHPGQLCAARRLRLLRGPRLLATDRTRECGRHYHPLLHGASPGDVAPRLRQRFT